MHRPQGRGLGGEAGPGLCHSSGTGPLPPVPSGSSREYFGFSSLCAASEKPTPLHQPQPWCRQRPGCVRPGEAQSILPRSHLWAQSPTALGMEAVPSKSRTPLPSLPSSPGADNFQPWLSIPKGWILPVGPHSRGGTCSRGTCSRGTPTFPHGRTLRGDHWVQGGSFVPPSLGGSAWIRPPGCLLPATAPYQHLPAEPAQMLQECGSATTRYCRNAPRVGKGRAGAVLPQPSLSPAPSEQLPALPMEAVVPPAAPGAGVSSETLGQAAWE